MASFELELKDQPNKRGECPIVLRVISNRVIKRKTTGIRVEKKYWDKDKSKIKSSHVNSVEYNSILSDILNKAAVSHAVKMKSNINVSGAEIIKDIFQTHDFKQLIQNKIDLLNNPETFRTRKKYITLKNLIDSFHPTQLDIESIDADFVNGFKKWLISEGKTHNTVVNRVGSLRSVFNDAGLKLPSPFNEKNVTVGSFRASEDEPLTPEEIKLLWDYTSKIKTECEARDMFLFSFYTAGMRANDVLLLYWSEISAKEITYRPDKVRKTTAIKLTIPLNKYSKEILSRYEKGTPTVFNKIKNLEGIACLKEIESRLSIINASLKIIALKLGIQKILKFKLARTTFAAIANKNSGRNVYGIKQAMGHSKISTTEIYLGNDTSAIGELLKKVYK